MYMNITIPAIKINEWITCGRSKITRSINPTQMKDLKMHMASAQRGYSDYDWRVYVGVMPLKKAKKKKRENEKSSPPHTKTLS